MLLQGELGLSGNGFVEAARLEPIVDPGDVWLTDDVKALASRARNNTSFYFEDMGEREFAKGYGERHVYRAHWKSEEQFVKTGLSGALLDEQYYRRVEASRRFAFIWLLLDQLPVGSWGRSVPTWMSEVWRDIPSIPMNPLIEDEGGFETTIFNLDLIYSLLNPEADSYQICGNAHRYLAQRYSPRGFGTLGLSRHGAEVVAQPRHTALAGWLLGCSIKDITLTAYDLRSMFRTSVLSLLGKDPETTAENFKNDRNPLLLYLATWHVVNQVGTSEWNTLFSEDEHSRIKETWQRAEDGLLSKALAKEYPHAERGKTGGPKQLIEARGQVLPLTVPYSGFVRMEAYSLLSATLLVEQAMPNLIKERLKLGVTALVKDYLRLRTATLERRDPLRPEFTATTGERSRGPRPYFVDSAHPDIGTAAMLARVLRTEKVVSTLQLRTTLGSDLERARYLLEEDIVEQFDRYVIAPQLFSLTHAGMMAAILPSDHPTLLKSIRERCGEILDHPPPLDLKDDNLDQVLSEQFIYQLMENIVASDDDCDPRAVQVSTHSLTRLLVSRLRPGQYLTTDRLGKVGINKISLRTASVYRSPSFLARFDEIWANSVDHTILGPFLDLIKPGSRVLDVGSGPGHYSLEIARSGHSVDLLDFSEPALKLGAERLQKLGQKTNTYNCDILRPADRSIVGKITKYDAIWCSGILAHIPKERWADILEWFRDELLTPDGVLFVNIMFDNPCVFARDGRYFTFLRSPPEFEAVLSKTGFDVRFMLQKSLQRNTYAEPLLETFWANYYAGVHCTGDTQDLGSLATVLTTLAYERSSNVFVQAHEGSGRTTYITNLLDKLAAHSAAEFPRVLDAGCGPGHMVEAMVERGWEAVGVDVSNDMIGQATENMRSSKRAAFFLYDLSELPREWSGTFDAVLCVTALQHVPRDGGKLQKVLQEFSRVLKPGGVARIDLRISASSGFDPDLRYIDAFRTETDIFNHTREAGFTVIGEPSRSVLPAGRNSFRRQIELVFSELWLQKE